MYREPNGRWRDNNPAADWPQDDRREATSNKRSCPWSLLTRQSEDWHSLCGMEMPALSLQCIRDQKIPIALGVIIAVLVSVIIALAVRAPQACPSPIDAACPDGWIGNRGKCYFFSETEGNWTSSQSNCSSLSASLAVIDSQQDLAFMLRYKGPSHHWIGLRKEPGQPWKWPDGTEFNNMFSVRGEGQCAFLNEDGVSSSRCYSERGFICSRPDDCTRRKPSAARGDTV